MRPRLTKVWVNVIKDDQIGGPETQSEIVNNHYDHCLDFELALHGHEIVVDINECISPYSNWPKIVQDSVPNRAQHKRHQNREKIVAEDNKEINDAIG